MAERSDLGGLTVALVLGSSTGGIGRHVRDLAAGLAERGANVTVYGPASTQGRFCFTAAGARFEPVEIPAGPRPADLVAVRRLRRAAATADVVHAHGLRAGLLAALARTGSRPPLAVTWHNAVLGGVLRRRAYGVVERLVARAADVTLGASDDLVARARSLGGHDCRLAPIAAPPFPPPSRDPAQVRAELGAADRPLVLAVARLHPQKRLDVLVAASRRWACDPCGPLTVVAGEGPLRDRLAGSIAASAAPVRLLGHRDDVPDLLAAADVVVVSSEWEARPFVAQEALRAGRPLVATAVGGIPGLVGEAAVLVPPGDPVALADAVDRVLGDRRLAAGLAAGGPARAAGWPGRDETVELVAGVYRDLIRGAA